MTAGADGSVIYTLGHAEQRSMLLRSLYFIGIGWWACMLTMLAAWMLSVLILTMPAGLMLLNRLLGDVHQPSQVCGLRHPVHRGAQVVEVGCKPRHPRLRLSTVETGVRRPSAAYSNCERPP